MAILRYLLSESRWMFISAIAAAFINGVANVAMLAIVNAALTARSRSGLMAMFLACCLLTPVTRILSETLLVHLGQNVLRNLRSSLARQVSFLSLEQLERFGPHRITLAFNDDLVRIGNVAVIIPYVCMNIGMIVSCFAYMAYLSGRAFIAFAAIVIFGVLTSTLLVSSAVRCLERARVHDDAVQKHLRALLLGFKELKLHLARKAAFFKTELDPAIAEARRDYVDCLRRFSWASSWGQLLLFVALGSLVFVFSGITPAGTRIAIGYSFCLIFLMSPLQTLIRSVPDLSRANLAARNLSSMGVNLASVREDDNVNADVPSAHAAIALRLEDLTYTYAEPGSAESFSVGPISLSIATGELVFITGGNGSGKTTLVKLLVGLYKPERGRIFYNGAEVNAATQGAFRQQFSAVFSDCFVFDCLLGLDSDDLDLRASKYLGVLQLDPKIKVRNGAFSTTRVSQGQKKRLALLTAYLEDRPIYIFDEWAADQDPAFRYVFYHQLLPDLKRRGKTIIVITHDDRFFHLADCVLRLENGRVVDATRPAVLTNGAF